MNSLDQYRRHLTRAQQRLKWSVEALLDRRAIGIYKKERSNLGWFYAVPPNCDLPLIPYYYEYFLGQRDTGLFVEVGAFDGWNFSNTWGLAAKGWSGYFIEPDPVSAERCRQRYRQMGHVMVSECAISDGSAETLRMHRAGAQTTSSTTHERDAVGDPFFRQMFTDEFFDVTAMTLNDYLERQEISPDFDVLVIDVEGTADAVFRGFTIDKWRPKMMIVELFDLHPSLSSTSDADRSIRRAILDEDYETVYRNEGNTVFVRRDVVENAYGDRARA